MRSPWTVIMNTWPYSPEEIERAVAPLTGWADRIVGTELGVWHRPFPALTLSTELEVSGEWTGSFRTHYDRLMRREKRSDTARVLLLEGNEVIRRMDLGRLEELTDGFEAAHRLCFVTSADDPGKKEIRILKPSRWHGFSGVYKPDPYPELAAFCENMGDSGVRIFRSDEDRQPWAEKIEKIMLKNPPNPLARVRWFVESRQFAQGLRVLKKHAARNIESARDYVEWKTLMAEILLGMNKPLEALQALTPLMSVSPTADRGYLMGRGLYELGRYDEASAHFFQAGTGMLGERDCQESGSDSYRALLWAAHSFLMANRPKDSFGVLKRLLESYPFFQDGWILFFRLFTGATPQELYEIITQFLPSRSLYEVFERMEGLDQEGGGFRQWILH